MDPGGLRGRGDGGRRVGLGRQRLQQAGELVDLVVGAGPARTRASARVSRETLRSRAAGRRRRDDEPPVGLVALAVGLDVRALAQVGVHDLALERAHRLELDRAAVAQGVGHGAVGLALEGVLAPLAVARGVDHDPAAVVAVAAQGDPHRQVLERVDRGPVLADQQPEVLALDRGPQLLVGLGDLDLGLQVQLVDHPLDHVAQARGRLVGGHVVLGAHRRGLPAPAGALLLLARGLGRRRGGGRRLAVAAVGHRGGHGRPCPCPCRRRTCLAQLLLDRPGFG